MNRFPYEQLFFLSYGAMGGFDKCGSQDCILRALVLTGVSPQRRGKKKAIMAVTHSRATAIYHNTQIHDTYRELVADFLDKNIRSKFFALPSASRASATLARVGADLKGSL